MTDIERLYAARDVFNGLQYIQKKHDRNHGDIHGNNIAYDKNSSDAKLNDFDLSRKL